MPAAAHLGQGLQPDAADAHHGPGIGVAVRLQPVKGADIVDTQQSGVVDQQIALHFRQGGGLVGPVIAGQGGPEIVQLVNFDVQPRGQGVAAEAHKVFGTGVQRLEQVEATEAAAGALARVPVETDHNGGQGVLLRQPGGGDADDTLMPPVAGQDDRRVRHRTGELGVGLVPDLCFNVLPLAVQLAQLHRKLGGGPGVCGHQQLRCSLRLAQPAGGVQPGGQTEANGRGSELAGVDGGLPHHGGNARAGRGAQLFQPTAYKTAVFPHKGHHVRHGAYGHKVRVLLQHLAAVPLAGAGQLQRHAHTGQVFVGIRVPVLLAVYNCDGPGELAVAALVMVGDDDLQPDPGGVVHLGQGGDAAVHGDEEIDAPGAEGVHSAVIQPVALLVPVRYVGQTAEALGAQIVRQQAGGGDAVHIIVAVDGDGLAPGDGLSDPFNGCRHAGHQHGVVQHFIAEEQLRRRLAAADAPLGQHRGQQRRKAALQQLFRQFRPAI